MPSAKEIRTANEEPKNSHDHVTAVFVGATNGIGFATLKAFARHLPYPKAIIIGRSRKNFDPRLEELRKINTNGTFVFLEADVSLIKNIDAVCGRIEEMEGEETSTSSSKAKATPASQAYYGRVRFASNIAPLLKPNGKIVNVHGGGKEMRLVSGTDLELKSHHSIPNVSLNSATLTTLSFDHLAASYSDKAFIHTYPGFVMTGTLGRNTKGVWHIIMRLVEILLGSTMGKSADECGETTLNVAMNPKFANGCITVDSHGALAEEGKALREYRKVGFSEKVWKHNQETFQRVTVTSETKVEGAI